MKPIKGMNLDVSPDAQPEGTYRIAKNFVYDAEFDGLQQDFGTSLHKAQLTANHVIASYSFNNGDIVVLTSGAVTSGTTQTIQLFKGDTESFVIVEDDSGLLFDPSKVYDITHFEDADSNRHIIITGGGQKPLIFNVDLPSANQPDIGVSNLFPDRNLPTISQVSQSSGSLSQGSYFFSARYVLDETRTDFGPPFGPIRLIENGSGLTLQLDNLDTRYDKVEIGMIGVSNAAISTKVVGVKPVTATSAQVFCGGESFGEALLEEVAILPQVYTAAETVEFHDNRLYLGNVKTHDESGLQQKANAITTCWEIIKNPTGAPPTNTGADPNGSFFAPGEVYAFYVAWVRDDGSMTQAYHIPGRPKKNFTVKVISSAANLADSADPSIDPTSTIDTLLADTSGANAGGQLDFLKNDKNVLESDDPGYGDTKFFQTRCTATKFNNKSVGPIDFHHGRMSYWENANEQYPANFPTGRDIAYNSSGLTVDSDTEEVLAGQNVRHHRMPSLGWLIDKLSDPSTGFDFDAFQEHGLKVRFDFVEVPAGYQSAVIFHAVRNTTNSTVFTHTPIHFGNANHFAWFGDGGEQYRDYSTVSVINSRNANAVFGDSSVNDGSNSLGSISGSTNRNLINSAAGEPKEFDGTAFTASDTHLNSTSNKGSYKTEYQDRLSVHYNKAVAFAQDVLATKPLLPKNMYTTFEYMLVQMEHFPTEVTGNTAGSTGRTHTMVITTGEGNNGQSNAPEFFETNSNDDGTNKSRRFLMDFTENYTGNVVQSFSHSRILPMRNQRYMPAGVIDDEVKFDNRRGAECFYWDYKNIANTETPYVGGHGNSGFSALHQNAGDRLWFSVLNSNAGVLGNTATGNTDAARFTRQAGNTTYAHDQMDGFLLQSMATTEGTLAVCRLPFVTVMSFQQNCYLNRDTQDLSLCTATAPVSTMLDAPTGTSASGLKTITSDKVFGDIHYSKTQYRVTSNTGYNVKLSASDEDDAAPVPQNSSLPSVVLTGVLGNSQEKGTFDGFRGVLIGLFKVNTYSPVSYLFHNEDKLQHKEKERESLMRNASPEETNDFTLNADFLKVNNFLQPTISDGVTALDFTFPYRVARSKAQDTASDALNLRKFPALDFIEQTRTRGSITHLQSYGDKLLIHHQDSLFISIGKEAVATTTGSVVLGTGDIFRVQPTELIPSEYGFAGSQHIQGCTLTPQGYFFVDVRRRRVFLYDGKINEISNKGMRKWFQDNLQLGGFQSGSDNGQITQFQPGVHAEYDPVFNRVLLMIRNNELKSGQNYNNSIPAQFSEYEVNDTFTPKDKVISYSLHTGAWISLHDLPFNKFAATATKIYGLRTKAQGGGPLARIFELFDPSVSSINYLALVNDGTKAPAQIDVSFPTKDPVQWQSFSWHTKAVDHVPTSANFGHYDLTTTFEKAAVYNDYQCSGDLTFTKANEVDIANVQQVTLRHNGTRNAFNGFRDLVDNTAVRFLDPDYNFVTSNLNVNKNWFDQRRVKSTHAVLRLISTLDTTKRLYLYDIDAKVRKSYR